MLCISLLLSLLPALAAAAVNLTSEFHTSEKRGLVYVPNSDFPEDDKIWIQEDSDLTWYYNYKMYPSAEYEKQTHMQFIPMMWGAPRSFNDMSFYKNITGQLDAGNNITYVMGFNEPDNTAETGGSDIDPTEAAKYWKKQMEPLRKLGLQLGAPAVTGGTEGFDWLSDFGAACDGECTFDFVPIHWYGSFDGLVNHINDVVELYPGKRIWVTEFALDNAKLDETQEFFQTALTYMDKNENVSHYSYFGAFRSFTSNVGMNVAMLNSYGKLTDIGSWYLGGNATGIKPDNVKVKPNNTAAPKETYIVPALVTKLPSGGEAMATSNFFALALGLGLTVLQL